MADPISEIDGQVNGLVGEMARRKEAILQAVVDYNNIAYDAGTEAVAIRFRRSASGYDEIQFPASKEEMQKIVAGLSLK
jgi:hypothetical protein